LPSYATIRCELGAERVPLRRLKVTQGSYSNSTLTVFPRSPAGLRSCGLGAHPEAFRAGLMRPRIGGPYTGRDATETLSPASAPPRSPCSRLRPAPAMPSWPVRRGDSG
jgi:hypothetical protein